MKAEQFRAARAMLGIGVREVASGTGLMPSTVSRAENGKGDPKYSTVIALEDFYEARGVQFMDDGAAVGVMFTPSVQRELFEGEDNGD